MFNADDQEKLQFGQGQLMMKAQGAGHREGTSISLGANNISFEITVQVEVHDEAAWAGISLGPDGIHSNGVTSTFTEGPVWRMTDAGIQTETPGHVYLKIRNYRKDLSFFVSNDGVTWKSFGKGLRVNNSYDVRLFAWGEGVVIFRDFRYQGLE